MQFRGNSFRVKWVNCSLTLQSAKLKFSLHYTYTKLTIRHSGSFWFVSTSPRSRCSDWKAGSHLKPSTPNDKIPFCKNLHLTKNHIALLRTVQARLGFGDLLPPWHFLFGSLDGFGRQRRLVYLRLFYRHLIVDVLCIHFVLLFCKRHKCG